MCTTKEKLTKNTTAFEDQLQFVSDAVMAFAYALRQESERERERVRPKTDIECMWAAV